MATATHPGGEAETSTSSRREQLRGALESALAEADADEHIGPLIAATRLQLRFEFTDLEMVFNVAAADGEHNLTWSFADDPGWLPKLVLRMNSETANRYLQGRESLAIGIARGQVHCQGDSTAAMLYLPAARLISGPYRHAVETDYPALAA